MIEIFGPAGAGKGTQASRLAKMYGLEEVTSSSVISSQADERHKEQMRSGVLLRRDDMRAMFERHIDQMANPADSIFDGFPRTPEQAEDLWAILQAKGVPLEAIIVLRVSRAVCSGRLRGRLEQEHREDDANVAAVERRLDDYERYTVPAYQKLAELSGLPIIEVDGELPEDQVTTQILSRLREQGVRAQGFEDAA